MVNIAESPSACPIPLHSRRIIWGCAMSQHQHLVRKQSPAFAVRVNLATRKCLVRVDEALGQLLSHLGSDQHQQPEAKASVRWVGKGGVREASTWKSIARLGAVCVFPSRGAPSPEMSAPSGATASRKKPGSIKRRNSQPKVIQVPVGDDDIHDEESAYLKERKAAAWWAQKPIPSGKTVEEDGDGPPADDKEEREAERRRKMKEASVILGKLMRQKTFVDGDQELLSRAFSCIQADGDSSGRIDYNEFWEALAPISENMREQDKQELFLKVDQECSGSVDLFDFLNFFLVTSYEQLQRPRTSASRGGIGGGGLASRSGSSGKVGMSSRGGKSSRGQSKASKRQMSVEPTPSFYDQPMMCAPAIAGHKDVMIGIFRNKATDAYATVARDGTMSTWTKDLKFLRTVSVADPRQNLGHNLYTSPGVITASCYTPHSCLVGVASMKRQLRFYDVGAPERPGKRDEATLAFAFRPLPRAVMSLECSWMNDGHEMLVCGDDEGYVSYYKLFPGWHRLDGGPSASYNEKRFSTDYCKTQRWQAHNAWVTKAKFVDALHSVASSGYDNVFTLFDLESSKVKWSLDASKVLSSGERSYAHTKGIRTWDWTRQFNVFATGGVERVISLWSPFVSKPVGVLQGHASSIQQIICNERHNQIISLGSDKTVRVWDVRNLKCVCSLTDNNSHIPENRFYNMFLDVSNEQLVLGSGRPHRHPMKHAASVNESAYGLVAVAVSPIRNLLATADEINEVRMWRPGSGMGVSSFNGCPTAGAQITALAFDLEQLRLLVAASDGVVRLCNHGNGLVLKQYGMDGPPLEIHTLISALERGESMIYAATDAGGLCNWKDTGEATSDRPIMPERVNTGAHESDVMDAVTLPPDIVVTCSYDGRVAVWSAGHLRYAMTDSEHDSKPSAIRGMVKLAVLNLRRLRQRRKGSNQPSANMATVSEVKVASAEGASQVIGDATKESLSRKGSAASRKGSVETRKASVESMKASVPEESVGAEGSGASLETPMGESSGSSLSLPPSSEASSFGLHGEGGHVKGMIISAGMDGFIHVWDLVIGQHAFKVQVFKSTKSSFGVVEMCIDHTMSFLACGDAHGYVKIFDVSGLQTRKDATSVILLHTFRAHHSSLISAHFVKAPGDSLKGSSVLITASHHEMRMWTVEGDFVGQFGRENWDLTSGVKNRLRKDDIADEPFMEEDEGRIGVILSELMDNPASIAGSLDNSEDEIGESIEEEKDSMSPVAKVVESHLRYFASDDTLNPPGASNKSLKPVMPKDWKKSKKFDVHCFAKMTLKDLSDTKSWRDDSHQFIPTRPEKHKMRMKNAIRELSATPNEMRYGLATGAFLKPTTPEIYGLSAPKRRAASSML